MIVSEESQILKISGVYIYFIDIIDVCSTSWRVRKLGALEDPAQEEKEGRPPEAPATVKLKCTATRMDATVKDEHL